MKSSLSFESDFLQVGKESSLSEKPVGFIADKEFYGELSQERILSWMVGFLPETSDQYFARNYYEELKNSTVTPLTSGNPPVVWLPQEAQRKSYFITMQKWEGVVIDVLNDSFIARLVNISHEKLDEEAEILKDELSDDDLELVKPGAVFYWTIGYHIDPSGQRKRASIIRFRRLPMWTSKEIEAAKQEAETAQDLLDWK